MKKKSKNQVYIPHQDKWNEHFPTPGKPNPQLLHRFRCNLQQAPTYPNQIKTEKRNDYHNPNISHRYILYPNPK